MNKRPIQTTAGVVAVLAAGLASAQVYATRPAYGYSTNNAPARVVRCESTNSRRNFCRADTRGGVQVYRQLSRQSCIRGRNWQASRSGITVSGGCRADFVVRTGYDDNYEVYTGSYTTDRFGRRVYDDRYSQVGNYGTYGNDETFHCEGTGHGRTYCGQRGQHYFMKYRSPSCLLNRTWGNDAYGTWVSGACNADFSVQPIADRYGRDDDGYYGGNTYDPYGNDPYGNDPYRNDSGYPGTYGTPMGNEAAIYCQSTGSGRTYCGDRNRTYSLRTSSGGYCVEGQTYGRDSYGTWVSGRCNITLEPGAYDRY